MLTRLSRLFPPLRQELSLHRRRLRHRDRTDRPCRAPDDADGGDGHPLQGAPGGFGVQAQHLARRLPHPVHHRLSGARGTAAGVLRLIVRLLAALSLLIGAPVVDEYFWHTGWCRACPPRVLATGLMVLAFLSLTCGLDPGHGDARPLGGQAHGLSGHPGAARPASCREARRVRFLRFARGRRRRLRRQ